MNPIPPFHERGREDSDRWQWVKQDKKGNDSLDGLERGMGVPNPLKEVISKSQVDG
jgi:hypothetical protein